MITPELPGELYQALSDRAHEETREQGRRVSMQSLVIVALEKLLYGDGKKAAA